MTLLAKLGIATLGGGSIAAGGYGIYELSKPKTIGQQLKWEGKTLGDVVGTSDDDATNGLWHNLYTKYSTDSNNKFKENEADVSEINDKSKLKAHCDKVFKMPKTDEDNLKKAGFWCVKESEKLSN